MYAFSKAHGGRSTYTRALLGMLVWLVALSLSGCGASKVTPADAAGSGVVPADCPYVCTHEYALCIAASCDAKGHCGKCDATDGSCGYCYVFKGQSCSYREHCDDVAPTEKHVYSTYSEILAQDFGFKTMRCSGATSGADCMDAQCTRTGETVTLTNTWGEPVEVHTAKCKCTPSNGGGETLGGQCNTANCSAIWSTAGTPLKHQPQCCSE